MTQLPVSILLLLLIFFPLSAFCQDDEVIKVDSSLVVVNATVLDVKGNPVRNLKRSEFVVLEDGKPRSIEFFETQQTPFAAVILIDTSGSMETRVSLARAAAINFLDRLRIDDQVAIYNFDTKVSSVQEFSNSHDMAPTAYDLKASGFTVLNDAIVKAAIDLRSRSEKRKAIIVISDGADTRSSNSSEKALKAALESDALIYTVDMSSVDSGGVSRMQSIGALKNFSEKSGGRFIPVSGGSTLRDAFKDIIDELGIQYTLGFQPSSADKDGKWRTIEIQISRPDLKIRTRKGYHAKKQ